MDVFMTMFFSRIIGGVLAGDLILLKSHLSVILVPVFYGGNSRVLSEGVPKGLDVIVSYLVHHLIHCFSSCLQGLFGCFYLYTLYVFHYGIGSGVFETPLE